MADEVQVGGPRGPSMRLSEFSELDGSQDEDEVRRYFLCGACRFSE